MKTTHLDRKFLIINGAIALFGLIVRLIAGFQLSCYDSRVLTPSKATDMWTYLNFAREILSGEVPRVFYYQPFYYSVFLPFVQMFSGQSMTAVIIAQSLCGALAVYLTGLLAARIAGKKAGLIGAALLALSQICIIYTPYALLETMQSFWLVLLLFMTFSAWSRKRLWLWFLTGVVLSFAILSRGNAWIFLPAIFLAVWYSSRGNEHRKRYTTLACLVVLLGTILPQMPFVVINSLEEGGLTGPSTAGGNVLALGNTPEAPPGGLTYPETYQVWMDHEKEISIAKRIFDWAVNEPAAFLELQFRKFFLFWDQREIPNNIDPRFALNAAPVLKMFRFLPTGILMLSALLCIFLGIKKYCRGKEHLLIAVLFVLLYNFAMAVFYILARFRVPCLPLICVLGGCGIFYFLKMFRKEINRRKNILTALLVLLLSWFIVYPGFDYYRENCEAAVMSLIRPDGINVPNRSGGRLIYDNGPMLLGGWQPVDERRMFKKFVLQEPIPAGEKVKISIAAVCLEGRPVIGLNGMFVDLSNVRKGVIQTIHLEVPFPADQIFRLDFTENLYPVVDTQRSYGRTFDRNGRPINQEMVISLSTKGKSVK